MCKRCPVLSMSIFFNLSTAISINNHRLSLPLFTLRRTFINARVKWVRDPYLDTAVEREKNLVAALSLKNLVLASSSNSLPIPIAAAHKPVSNFNFILRYPTLFKVFRPRNPPLSPPHVKVTHQFLAIHREENAIHESMDQKELAAQRLVKLLMLARAGRVPLGVIDGLKFDLGLPENFIFDLVSYFPENFRICKMMGGLNCEGVSTFGLELVSWREDLAVPAILKSDFDFSMKRGSSIRFPMSFPPGFDLQKRVRDWTENWESLTYISPYENAFHLPPSSDQMEKWTVAVIHELLSILVSKKTEIKNIVSLGDHLGFGPRFKKAILHFPGIFYMSNKIRTQTVVLREAYKKDVLLVKHPLMGMRHRYIYLMSKSEKLRRQMKREPLNFRQRVM